VTSFICRPPPGHQSDEVKGTDINAILKQLCNAQPMAVRQVAAAALCSFMPQDKIPSALDALVEKLLLYSSLNTANQVSCTPA
jgi:hypothetical protein